MSDLEADIRQLFRTTSPNDAGLDSKTGLPRVLLVDDEAAVLSGIHRLLRSHFTITTAEGGLAALEAVEKAEEPFAVVVTDMRMPGMDGIALLRELRERIPDTVRMLLTGFTDIDTAIAAVNEGNLFRFMTKPANPNQLREAIKAGYEQYRLVMSEQVLLEGTLRGAVGALVETLSLADPTAFSRAVRIRSIAEDLLNEVDVSNRWEIEVAAMLSQIGGITLTPAMADKMHRGMKLTEAEEAMKARLPAVAADLLRDIPRLEGVRDLISSLQTWKTQDTQLGTKLIHLATEVESLESHGKQFEETLAVCRAQSADYGDELMKALGALNPSASGESLVEVALTDLTVGMTLGADVFTDEGALLVGRGQVVTEGLLQRLNNFAQSGVLTQQNVFVTAEAAKKK